MIVPKIRLLRRRKYTIYELLWKKDDKQSSQPNLGSFFALFAIFCILTFTRSFKDVVKSMEVAVSYVRMELAHVNLDLILKETLRVKRRIAVCCRSAIVHQLKVC